MVCNFTGTKPLPSISQTAWQLLQGSQSPYRLGISWHGWMIPDEAIRGSHNLWFLHEESWRLLTPGSTRKELHWNPGVFCFSQPNCPASCVPRLNTLKHQSYGARFQTDVSVFASTRTTTCNWKFIGAITWRKNCGSWSMLHLPSLPVHLHSN